MKQVWEQIYKNIEKQKEVGEKNKKIEQKIQKKKQKLMILDIQRGVLDKIFLTQSQLKDKKVVLDKLQNRLTDLEQWKQHWDYNNRITQYIIEKERGEDQLKDDIMRNTNNYIKKQQEYNLLEQQIQIKQKKQEEHHNIKEENAFLQKLLHVLHRDSLPMYFLEQYLPRIENRINELISPFLKHKKIVLKKEQKKETVNIMLSIMTMGTETTYMGGMEGFIVDASVKEVLAEVSLQCNSNLFIIDEGISALDKKNMENLDRFFHFLEERHPHVFIISHLNEAQHIVRHSLYISKEDGYSKVVYV